MRIVSLRKTSTGDREFAYLTKKVAFKEYVEKSGGWNEEEQRGLHNRRFASQDFQIIQFSGINVGILALVRLPDCVKINQMFILPEYQEKGIGAACLNLVCDETDKRPVRLQVLKVNPRATAFYQKHGFNRVGETDTHILMERVKSAAMNTKFAFLDPGKLADGDLELVLVEKSPADPVKKYVPQYHFEMRHPGETAALGFVRLRIGSAVKLHYPGHIGYEVKEAFRGHRYAARSSRLLFSLAKAHGLKAVWLSIDPHNLPSLKTCRIIGGKYIETVRLPEDHEMYRKGFRYVRRYRVDLSRTD